MNNSYKEKYLYVLKCASIEVMNEIQCFDLLGSQQEGQFSILAVSSVLPVQPSGGAGGWRLAAEPTISRRPWSLSVLVRESQSPVAAKAVG